MKHCRYRGLEFRKGDGHRLKALEAKGAGVRVTKRIFALRLLSQGKSLVDAATSVGMYPRAMSRLARSYISGGLTAALYDKPRRHMAPILTSSQKQLVVALCCGPAPEGRSRWTIRLLAHEAVARGVVPKVARETIRMILSEHDLKPWREKNVVRSKTRRTVHRANGEPARSLRTP
jgi:putative transposase